MVCSGGMLLLLLPYLAHLRQTHKMNFFCRSFSIVAHAHNKPQHPLRYTASVPLHAVQTLTWICRSFSTTSSVLAISRFCSACGQRKGGSTRTAPHQAQLASSG